jgi:multidrug efflux pump subunit AcrA (membrane-fusion protein)
MTEEFKPQSETNDRADKSQESASVLEPVEIGQEGESAQSAMAETKENEVIAEARTPKKKRHIARIVIAVLIVVMVGVGYLKRDSLFGGKAADEPAALGDQAKADLKVLYWVDPMHPNYKSDKPGKAPDCGMDLLPVYESGISPSNLPEGAFLINAEKQQLIGVTYGEVTSEQVSKTLRAVGRLAYDETKISHVHTKIEGWIEDVYVDFTGKPVKKGDPLLTIYSPELLQTQQEFLLAIRGRKELAGSSFRGAAIGAESLYESTRRRLELWDISEGQIQEIERTGKTKKAMPLYAPATGIVLTRNAYPKQRIMPDTELYTVADLSSIWVLADIYEYEATEVILGQTATVTLTYLPSRTFRGKITYIYPQVDPTTRTLKVRIEIPNPNLMLKPDMFANVELNINYGKKLIVPQEAVMDSGSEQTVFVALEGGYFEPRRVMLGAKVDGKYIVLEGLKAGERIVTSGNFLVDSESKLKSAAGGMGMPGMNHGGGAPSGGKQSPQVDHSQHQQGGQQPSQAKPEDHSQHQQQAAPQVKQEDHLQHQAKPQRKTLYWYDPMHPNYKSDKPGKAPDCGMDLLPKYADEKK